MKVSRSRGMSMWVASGVPSQLPKHKLFKPEHSKSKSWTDAYRVVNRLLGNGIIWVLLGPCGTGKTQMGVCLVRDVCRDGYVARYTRCKEMYRGVRSAFDGETSESAAIRKLVEPSLLVIDACEERERSAWADGLFTEVIDKRYSACQDTVLISNETVGGFSKSAGASVISRIHECGGVTECVWSSFREQKRVCKRKA